MDRIYKNVGSVPSQTNNMKKRLQRGVIVKTLQEHFERGVYWYFVRKNKTDNRMFVKQIRNGMLQEYIITATNMEDMNSENILYPINIGTRLFNALNRASNIPEKVQIVSDLSINHIYNILQRNDETEIIIKFINMKYNITIYCTCGNILIGNDYYSIELMPLNSKSVITLTNKMEQCIETPKSKVKKRSCFGYTRI